MRGKWWVALIALIACPIATYLLTFAFEKRYTASMRLLTEQSIKGYDPNASPFSIIDDITGSSRPRSVESVVNILTGSDVLVDAIERARVRFPKAFEGQKAADKYESLVRRLAVDSSPQNDVIAVRVTMDDPEIAAEIANQIAYAYIDFTRKMETNSGNAALTIIKKQLDDTRSRLNTLDGQIKTIKESFGIADPASSSQYASQGVAVQETELSKLQGQLAAARAELSVAQEAVRSTPKMVLASSSMQLNPTLQDLEIQRSRLETNLSGLRTKYSDNHPDVKALLEQLKATNTAIKALKDKIQARTDDALNPNYQQAQLAVINAKARIASLSQQVSEGERLLSSLREKLRSFPDAEKQLEELRRQKIVLEANYAQLDQRRDLIEATGSGRKNPSQIVSTALPPSLPSFPDARLFILIGLAIGFVVGALIIMPKGDMDLYGQWPRSDAKGLRGGAPSAVDATMPDAPAIGEGGDPKA